MNFLVQGNANQQWKGTQSIPKKHKSTQTRHCKFNQQKIHKIKKNMTLPS